MNKSLCLHEYGRESFFICYVEGFGSNRKIDKAREKPREAVNSGTVVWVRKKAGSSNTLSFLYLGSVESSMLTLALKHVDPSL